MLGYLNIPRIDVVVAESVDEAVKALAKDREREVLAAGTDVLTSLTTGEKRARKFVDITRIEELKQLTVTDSMVDAGALVTHHQIASQLAKQIPAFDTFLQNYSSPAVSYRATLGGSLMLRRATEDLIPILLTLDADLVFETIDGEKRISLQGFLREEPSWRGVLKRVSFRLSRKCLFDKLWLGVSRFPLMAVAVDHGVGNVGVAVSHRDFERPGRVFSVERFLENNPLTSENIEKAGDMLSRAINPVDDVLASAWYRRKAAGVLLKRLLLRRAGDVM